MAEFVLEEAEQFEAIPDGEILAAEVSNVEHRETPFEDERNPGKNRWEVSFRFKVLEEGPFYGRTVFGRTPTTFSSHPDCKLRVWVQELLGEDSLPSGFKFDTDTLIGLPCRIAVTMKEKPGKDGTPVKRNDVVDVLRPSARSAADIF